MQVNGSETTPLLSQHQAGTSLASQTTRIPPIGPAVDALLHTLDSTRAENGLVADADIPDYVAPELHTLVVVLSALLRMEQVDSSRGALDTWNASKKRQAQQDELTVRAVRSWNDLLEAASSDEDLTYALWLVFPVDDGDPRTIRAIDLLAHHSVPASVTEHVVLDLHVRKVWREGIKPSREPDTISGVLLSAYDRLATPRSLHGLDVLGYAAFISVLLNYLVDPPSPPVISDGYLHDFGSRGILLCIYAAAHMLLHRNIRGIFFGLIVLAFIAVLPVVPMPGDGAFELMSFSFILHVILLHVPFLPNSMLLFTLDRGLPISTMLWQSVTQAWLPILGFFLPALILSMGLVSMSLADTFPTLLLTYISEAPIETRAAFLSLVLLILFFIGSSMLVAIVVFASTPSQPSHQTITWDRYGKFIGLTSRRSFNQAVIAYQPSLSSPHPFPAPLSLLPVLLIRGPQQILRLLGRRDFNLILGRSEQYLWRLTIVPLAAVLTAIGIVVDRMS